MCIKAAVLFIFITYFFFFLFFFRFVRSSISTDEDNN